MKRYAVIVAIHANHNDLEISQFLKFARSFVHKVRRELEATDGNVKSVAKHKKHEARSDRVKTSHFVQQIQGIIDEDPSKSIRARESFKFLSAQSVALSTKTSGTSPTMRKGQFMSARTREQRFIRAQ